MKNLLFLIITCALSSSLFGQGNLQFNQVINISSSQSYTVPANKCFKLESIQVFNASASSALTNCACNPSTMGVSQCTYAGGAVCNIAGIALNYNSFTQNGSTCSWQSMCPGNCPPTASTSISFPYLSFPIWLSEGKVITIGNVSGVLLSGIEFNIIP